MKNPTLNSSGQKNTNVIVDEKIATLKFPVVGIGASAGGLEALQEFFQNMPLNPGAAFVIVQHLSPDYKSLMNELLAQYTNMEIHRVENGMIVKKNHIYLIPPRMNMTIYEGKLLLSEYTHGRTLNLPIDIFLRSLAKSQQYNAIGVILSGTGSDGTIGIRAIKEYGGIAMVQDDRSAKFDGMPRSSISTGMVDFILPPAELAASLSNYIKHPFIKKTEQIEDQFNQEEDQKYKIISILRENKGVDFSEYKENTIIRRLEKRISINRFEKIDDYIRFLTNNSREVNILFDEFLIGVTRFFRDEDAFNKISTDVLPELLKEPREKRELRLWVAGCSTGEEAYSLAMLIREFMLQNNIFKDVKIFATDIDSHSLEYAGAGFYPESIANDISPERISKFFIRKEGGYQVNETIRSMVIFARHNIMQDPPFSKIDLISCRNLLIYLNTAAQQKILSMFYTSLVENGHLFLGSSESLGSLADGFITLDNKAKIYRYNKGFKPPHMGSYGISNIHNKSRSELKSLNTFLYRAKPKAPTLNGIFDEILADFVPPSVIVDENYDVVHTVHQVNKYLSIPNGQISLNLLKMLSKELGLVVSGLLRRAGKKNSEVISENIKLSGDDKKTLSIIGRKILDKKSKDTFYIVSFIEKERLSFNGKTRIIETVDVSNEYQERLEELERQLQFKSESLQATVEELETSNEELQSSNEELIASNEELQSTNEELQSVNEELYTVNSEHIKKIEELIELNGDMDNLLKNTNIGTLFLDKNLTIRKANNIASALTNILQSDLGRPIHHLSFEGLYKGFVTDIYSVIDSLVPVEREIKDKNNQFFLMRIIPYRTAENAVDGIIITFVNITSLKISEERTIQIVTRLESAMDMGGISWWEWNVESDEVVSGKAKYDMLGYQKEDIKPNYQELTELLHPDDYERVVKAMKECLDGNEVSYEVEYRIRTKQGKYLWCRDRGGVVKRNKIGEPILVSGVVENISRKKNVSSNQQITNYRTLLSVFDSLNMGVAFHDKKGKIYEMNSLAKELLGLDEMQLNGYKEIMKGWQMQCLGDKKFDILNLPGAILMSSGKKQKEKIINVYNPKVAADVKIKINAVALYHDDEKNPHLVYTIFEKI